MLSLVYVHIQNERETKNERWQERANKSFGIEEKFLGAMMGRKHFSRTKNDNQGK